MPAAHLLLDFVTLTENSCKPALQVILELKPPEASADGSGPLGGHFQGKGTGQACAARTGVPQSKTAFTSW